MISVWDWGRGRSFLEVSILGKESTSRSFHQKALTQDCSQGMSAFPVLSNPILGCDEGSKVVKAGRGIREGVFD